MIKLGIIGTNWITQQFVDATELSKEYQLVSVYSRDLQRATDFGNHNGATEFFDDLEEFFSKGSFDTVYIASPNSLHFEHAQLAIDHEKNVIVEKPAFSNQKEMTLVQQNLAKHPNVLYFEAARNIYTSNFKAIKDQVDQMDVITGANFTYAKYSSRYDNVLAGETPNVFSLKFAGGALQDLGVYTVYDAVTLFGMPDELAYYPQLIDTGVDGRGTAMLIYPDFTVTLNFGKIVNSYMTSEIYGLKDTIEIDSAGEIDQVVYIDKTGDRQTIGNVDSMNSMLPEAQKFAEIINDPSDPDLRVEYEDLRELSINVNKVLFNLRQYAHLAFPNDDK